MSSPISNERRRPLLLVTASIATAIVASACTGLAAGPESKAQLPVPASRDSAYVRARRALQTEVFTMDVVDSTHGVLVGTRYPSASAKLGTGAACRVKLALGIHGDAQKADLAATSQWVASTKMSDASKVCEDERAQVVERISQTVAPK